MLKWQSNGFCKTESNQAEAINQKSIGKLNLYEKDVGKISLVYKAENLGTKEGIMTYLIFQIRICCKNSYLQTFSENVLMS